MQFLNTSIQSELRFPKDLVPDLCFCSAFLWRDMDEDFVISAFTSRGIIITLIIIIIIIIIFFYCYKEWQNSILSHLKELYPLPQHKTPCYVPENFLRQGIPVEFKYVYTSTSNKTYKSSLYTILFISNDQQYWAVKAILKLNTESQQEIYTTLP